MDRILSTRLLPYAFVGARDDITERIMVIWSQIKAPLIVPLLRLALLLCLIMSLMLFIERVYMGVVITLVKLFGKKPEKRYKWETIKDDVESGNLVYPMVLVQIPMYNEKEVYQLSIGAACGLSWPSDRIIIQILDDLTDPVIKDMVQVECWRWASKGINIKYEIRDNRNGYKSGALKEGMKKEYVKQCDYVAIFDADFQPEPDFLWRTIPFLLPNCFFTSFSTYFSTSSFSKQEADISSVFSFSIESSSATDGNTSSEARSCNTRIVHFRKEQSCSLQNKDIDTKTRPRPDGSRDVLRAMKSALPSFPFSPLTVSVSTVSLMIKDVPTCRLQTYLFRYSQSPSSCSSIA